MEPIVEVPSDSPTLIVHTAEPGANSSILPADVTAALIKGHPRNLNGDSIIMLSRFKGKVRSPSLLQG